MIDIFGILSLLNCMNSLLVVEASLRLHVACLCFFKPNEDRNVQEEAAGFEAKGDITELEVRTRTCTVQSAIYSLNQWWIVKVRL